jgi:hypothetical protein
MLKPGVRVHGLKPEIVLALIPAHAIWREHGGQLVVTSGVDGTHKRASKHYSGQAVDLRIQGMPQAAQAIAALKLALGDDYDVILEAAGTPNEHCHLEYDPKEPL